MSRKSMGFKRNGFTVKWEDTFSHYVIRDCQGRAVSVTQTISDARAYIDKNRTPSEHILASTVSHAPASVVATQTSKEPV
jgi:hypothetical protein